MIFGFNAEFLFVAAVVASIVLFPAGMWAWRALGWSSLIRHRHRDLR